MSHPDPENASETLSTSSIENDLERLGALADELENPDIEIEPAVRLYQEGIELAKNVLSRLEDVEQTIETLTLDADNDQ